MECWDWEIVETEVTTDIFDVTDHGPLFGPVTSFTVVRDDNLNLVLTTTSASDSTSGAVERPAGSVYIPTAEVKLASRFGLLAIAAGVIPRSVVTTFTSTSDAKKQVSTIHSLRWIRQNASEPRYIIEWVENLPRSLIWPHFDDLETTGEKRRILRSPAGEIVYSNRFRRWK
jgi:hypothetical protein